MLISIQDSAHSRQVKMGFTTSTLDFFLREMVQPCKYQNNENTSNNTKIFFMKYLIEVSFKLKFVSSVALRKNERTVVSGISDVGGHNPVFQTTLLPLLAGDVVQLQVCLENRNHYHLFKIIYHQKL